MICGRRNLSYIPTRSAEVGSHYMPYLDLTCESCGQKLKANATFGTRIRCPLCSAVFVSTAPAKDASSQASQTSTPKSRFLDRLNKSFQKQSQAWTRRTFAPFILGALIAGSVAGAFLFSAKAGIVATSCVTGTALAGAGIRWNRFSKYVDTHSLALREISQLNTRFSQAARDRGAIKESYFYSLNSKAKFDRFDLRAAMIESVSNNHARLAAAVNDRKKTIESFNEYERLCREARFQLLGKTVTNDIDQVLFNRLEAKRFQRKALRRPALTAKIVGTAAYTSPKGRNSYQQQLVWTFSQLEAALRESNRRSQVRAQAKIKRQSISLKLRVDILRRDHYKCRWCRRGPDEVRLQIDHIKPVSSGGSNDPENLQVLCEPCNLGKSNRFIG